MSSSDLGVVISGVDLSFWMICFWWMHKISTRQDRMMTELHKVMRRTEETSKAEHELIKDVHPKVTAIEESVREVVEEAREKASASEAADASTRS